MRHRSLNCLALLATLLAANCRDAPLTPSVQANQSAIAAPALMPFRWAYTEAEPGTTHRIRARLTDANGDPVANARIRWSVISGAGSLASAISFTNANGVATQQWTLGPPGFQRVKAIVKGIRSALFTANSLSGDALVAPYSGDDQIVGIGAALAPFVVRVRDTNGQSLRNVPVQWVVTSGSASPRRRWTVTDAQGRATVTARVPALVQTLQVEARASGAGSTTLTARITDGSEIGLDTVGTDFVRPIYLTAPPGDPRLFVAERSGRVRVIKNGRILGRPFLDLRARVAGGGERGLLSVAFHPDFSSNGFFFVNFTDLDGHTRIERYFVAPGADFADPATRKPILMVEQPFGNHNGGHMLFGPSNRLFIALGDGGGAGDPNGNGQNRATLLGKLLRIKVDVPRPYAVPRNNPYWGDPESRPEIWALGLRNPWRMAIDSGLLYIADVGQRDREEINVVDVRAPGVNYGWSIMEGSTCFRTTTCDQTELTLPVVEYSHGEGCAVVGGSVYRGAALPEIHGHYFYTDFCSGWIRSFRYARDNVRDPKQWDQLGTIPNIQSFGVDGQGELYLLLRSGMILRLSRRLMKRTSG